MKTRITKYSGRFSALKGAIDIAINEDEFKLNEDIEATIECYNVRDFYDLVNERIKITNRMLNSCLQKAGVSQAAFCDEINCDNTQLNKALRMAEVGNIEKFPRSIPFPAIECLCNKMDIDMSKMFLGVETTIPLPKRYEVALNKIGSMPDRKQTILIKKIQELSAEYLATPNIMTLDDSVPIPAEDFRQVIGRRCRMYTDEKNMPPAYIIESGPIRRKATNLFDALNEEPPVFLGRISIMMAICYTSHLPLEYFLIRDLSQERLIDRIQYFKDNAPTEQQLNALKLFCNTEQNAELNNAIVATVLSY